jgi:hypothetical protein
MQKGLGFASGNYNTFCSSPKLLTAPVVNPASYSEVTASAFLRAQLQGHETAHTLPSSDDIVNVWS